MNGDAIVLEKEAGIAILTLNRPEKLNAMTTNMWARLPTLVEEVSRDDSVKVLIVTGVGKGFCAGSDASRLASRLAGEKVAKGPKDITAPLGSEVFALATLQKPTIAAVNGVAAGAGISIALACDIIIASEQGRFAFGWVNMGLVPDGGATYFLARLVGPSKALEFALTGGSIDAREAERLGLVNKTVPATQLMETTKELASIIADGPPIAIQLTKKGIYKGLTHDLECQLDFESYAQGICRGTEDHKEGVKAFMEKRKPEFKGK